MVILKNCVVIPRMLTFPPNLRHTPPYTYKTYIINRLYTMLIYYANITMTFKRLELACIELLYNTYIIPLISCKQSIQAKYEAMLVIALPVKAELTNKNTFILPA